MGNNSIFIVLSVICFAMFTGWIFSLAQEPDVTLMTVVKDYDTSNGIYEPGQNISSAPTGETSTLGSIFGFVFDIPIIGQILGFVSWIITNLMDMMYNVIVLPGYFPAWMSPIFAVFFFAFIVYVYIMLAPTKTG